MVIDGFNRTPGSAILGVGNASSGLDWVASSAGFGGTWVINAAGTRARCGGTNDGNTILSSYTPSTASYIIEADITVGTVVTSTLYYGICGYANGGSGRLTFRLTSNGSRYNPSLVYAWPSGTAVAIGSAGIGTNLIAGFTGKMRLELSWPGSGNIYTVNGFLINSANGLYQKPDGTEQSTPIACVTGTFNPVTSGVTGFVAPGKCGLFCFGVNSEGGIQFDNFSASAFGTLAVSPPGGLAGVPLNVNLIGTDTSWLTTLPNFTFSAGTKNSQNITGDGAATANYTPPGVAGPVSVTDPTGGSYSFAVVTSMVAGTLRVTASAGSIALASTESYGNNGAVTTRLYRHTRAGFTPGVAGTLIDTKAGTGPFIWLDVTAQPDIDYFYVLQVTDSTPGSPVVATSNQVVATIQPADMRLGVIGDSNLAANAGPAALLEVIAILTYALGLRVGMTLTNRAISGQSASSWADDSGGILTAALAAFGAAQCTHILIMLGTNDSNVGTYTTKMTSLVTTLTGLGYKVLLLAPPYSTNNTYVNNAIDFRVPLENLDLLANVWYCQPYHFQVMVGRQQAGQTSMLNSPTDEVHVLASEAVPWGRAIGYAILRALYPSGGSGGARFFPINYGGGF